jgi:short-subunit dehydrogenase
VTARRAVPLEELAQTIEGRGAECIAVPGDVTRQEDIERVVAATVERFGRVDVLVNNAGIQVYARFEDYTWEEIVRVFDVTCLGYLRFARAVLPHMRRQGRGHIINMLSMLSVAAAPLLSVYAAAKHALLGWSDSLRLELRGSGIDVSGILLPSVSTPMFDHARMKLGRAPKPIPPTYDTDVGARAVLRCLERPRKREVPVFLQGRLILWLDTLAPWLADFVLGRWGARLQMRDEPRDPSRGNLFAPVPEGVGPYGSVPPTPRWLRAAVTVGLVALVIGALRR